MLSNFLHKTYSLTTRIAQTFAKFDRSKGHVNGKYTFTQSAPSDTSIMAKPHSPQPSPNISQPNKKPSTSSMDQSIRPQKKKLEVSPSTLPPLSMKQILATMPM